MALFGFLKRSNRSKTSNKSSNRSNRSNRSNGSSGRSSPRAPATPNLAPAARANSSRLTAFPWWKKKNAPVKKNAGTQTNRALSKAAVGKAVAGIDTEMARMGQMEQAFVIWAGGILNKQRRAKALAWHETKVRALMRAMKAQRDEVRSRGVVVKGPLAIGANGTVKPTPATQQTQINTLREMGKTLAYRPYIAGPNKYALKGILKAANEGWIRPANAPALFDPKRRPMLNNIATGSRKLAKNVANKAVRGAAMKANLANLNNLRAKLAEEREGAQMLRSMIGNGMINRGYDSNNAGMYAAIARLQGELERKEADLRKCRTALLNTQARFSFIKQRDNV